MFHFKVVQIFQAYSKIHLGINKNWGVDTSITQFEIPYNDIFVVEKMIFYQINLDHLSILQKNPSITVF